MLTPIDSNPNCGDHLNKKIIAIVAVVIIIVAAAAAAVSLSGDDDNKEEKKGGLYALNATVIDVDMGGMSGTPKMIDTIEQMYHAVYGDFANGADKLTLADAKADTKFWSEYCTFDSLAKVNSDGTITYHTVVNDKTTSTSEKTLPAGGANKLIATGSAYAFTQYYMICAKYNVEPFSDAANKNSDLLAEFQNLNFAGLTIDAIKVSSAELASLYSSSYRSHCSSIKSYDIETMGQDVKDAYNNGANVPIVMGSATVTKATNAQILSTVEANGGHLLLNNAKTIPQTFAMVEEIGIVLGYADYVGDVLEDLELQLYKVYYSLQQHQNETHKAYFEGNSGKASGKTGSGAALCQFFGWDISLFDGAEHDTESLLSEKPDIIMFYTNDDRSMDVKMRIASA